MAERSGNPKIQVGTVISSLEGPSTRKFSFVIDQGKIVRRGQFIQLRTEEGSLIGRVSDVYKTNRYFMRPESVKEYQSSGKNMDEIFPVQDWEYLVADVDCLGVLRKTGFSDSLFPPSPGSKVFDPDEGVLTSFFGLDSSGLVMGEIPHHKISVNLNMTRLIQKHLAILAISGAGKSYMTSVLMEEILSRTSEQGQISTIVLDTHGEYSSFASDPKFSSQINVFPSNDIRIGLPNLSVFQLFSFLPELTTAQKRELSIGFNALKRERKSFTLSDLITSIDENKKIKAASKPTINYELGNLLRTGLFGSSDYPPLEDLATQAKMSLIDFSDTISKRKKQIIATYLSKKLFDNRRHGTIPPVFLIVEEAHQFVPSQASKANAISKSILTTIAREGRKFHISLCLVSQRPIQLATTILSQCNTNIIMRVTNPYDLDHIGKSSEGVTKSVLNQISSLPVGSGIIVGEAVNYPLFVNFRKRRSKESERGLSLEKAAAEYQRVMKQKKEDAESFM